MFSLLRRLPKAVCWGTLSLLAILGQTSASWAQKDADVGAIKTEAPETPAAAIPATPPSELPGGLPGSASPREIYLRTLKSISLIENSDGMGTGWVLDVNDRLLVTNKHVVGTDSEVKVYFPQYKNGELQVNRADYESTKPVRGVVMDSNEETDLAIVQVDELPEGTLALVLAANSSGAGERVHAIGGLPRGSQGMWKYSTGYVSQVSLGYATGYEIRIMQSNIDINPGNSGGPVVNDAGEVVGVCQSINTEARDVSYNVDVTEVRKYVDTTLPLLRSEEADALVEMGKRHRTEGRTETAMRLLTKALQKQPGMAAAKAERGWVFLANGDRVTALRDFSDAIKANESLTSAWRGRARVHREMEKYDESANDLSAAISSDPQDPNLYNERAIALEFGKAYDLALADYQRAISMAPRNPTFLANRADLYIKLSRYQEAFPDITKAVEMNPKNAWYNNLMGDVYYGDKQYDKALEYYLKAYELDDTRLSYLTDIGEAVQSQGNHEQGVRIWTMVIEKEGDNAYNYYSRAWSLRRLKRFAEALDDMNRAIQINSESARYYKERGDILVELGRSQDGQADLNRAAQLDPERYGNGGNANNNPPARNQNSAVVGTWYVNNIVGNGRLEMTQVFYADGRYEASIYRTVNGQKTETLENGTYRLVEQNVEFNTNLGQYQMPYRIEDGLLWLRFNLDQQKVWVGSTRR